MSYGTRNYPNAAATGKRRDLPVDFLHSSKLINKTFGSDWLSAQRFSDDAPGSDRFRRWMCGYIGYVNLTV
jgi:hypothetical protein